MASTELTEVGKQGDMQMASAGGEQMAPSSAGGKQAPNEDPAPGDPATEDEDATPPLKTTSSYDKATKIFKKEWPDAYSSIFKDKAYKWSLKSVQWDHGSSKVVEEWRWHELT